MKVFLTLLIVFSTVRTSFPYNFDANGKVTYKASERPNAPWRHYARENGFNGYTFHHIIPCNYLCEFWNVLVDRRDKFHRKSDYETLMKAYLKMIRVPDGIHNDIINAIRNGRFNNLPKFVTGETFKDSFSEKISWQAWNIVEGPLNNHRTDEEGDEFDDFQKIEGGRTPAIYATIPLLYNEMLEFQKLNLVEPARIKYGDVKSLIRMMNSTYQKYRADTPQMIKKSWWVKEGVTKNGDTCWRKTISRKVDITRRSTSCHK